MADENTFQYDGETNTAEVVRAITRHNKRVVIFNKQSGEFVSTASVNTASCLNGDLYKWKTVDIDVDTQRWEGNYDDGSVVNVAEAPVNVYERDMDRKAGEAITWAYNWYQQVNVIIPVMMTLIEKNNLSGPEVDSFLGLAEYIEDKRELNDRYKKAYQEGPDWKYISKDEERAALSRQLEGGIHELLGPKSGYLPPTEITGP